MSYEFESKQDIVSRQNVMTPAQVYLIW